VKSETAERSSCQNVLTPSSASGGTRFKTVASNKLHDLQEDLQQVAETA